MEHRLSLISLNLVKLSWKKKKRDSNYFYLFHRYFNDITINIWNYRVSMLSIFIDKEINSHNSNLRYAKIVFAYQSTILRFVSTHWNAFQAWGKLVQTKCEQRADSDLLNISNTFDVSIGLIGRNSEQRMKLVIRFVHSVVKIKGRAYWTDDRTG